MPLQSRTCNSPKSHQRLSWVAPATRPGRTSDSPKSHQRLCRLAPATPSSRRCGERWGSVGSSAQASGCMSADRFSTECPAWYRRGKHRAPSVCDILHNFVAIVLSGAFPLEGTQLGRASPSACKIRSFERIGLYAAGLRSCADSSLWFFFRRFTGRRFWYNL